MQQELPLLLCLSHLRWDFVFQRPQQLLTRAARSYSVVYVEEPVFAPCDVPTFKRSSPRKGITVLVPELPENVGEAQRDHMLRTLLDSWLAGRRIGVLWYYTPQALAFSSHLGADVVVYDNMDELSAFLGAPSELLAREEQLFGKADLVFTGGESLYEAKRDRHPQVHVFPSSVDASHFSQARQPTDEPWDQATIPRPRIGFFGVIDERMDMGLVRDLSRLKPGWQFVMIGPTAKIGNSMLPKERNIHWMGPRSYTDLPRYMASWDAGFMPFALNDATRFISPTKTPEFLAAGLRVASTPITDVVKTYGKRGLVEIAADAREMAGKLDQLLKRPKTRWLANADRFLSGCSWEKTWREMHALIRAQAHPHLESPAFSETYLEVARV